MAKLPMRDVAPYNSILMQVPAHWNEDTIAQDLCIYYYEGNSGPPMFYIRRDDFAYDGEAAALLPGQQVVDPDEPPDTTQADAELFERFKKLATALDVPDLYFPKVEPRTPRGQLIRYRRHGLLDGKPGVAWWWIRGQRVGKTFAVVSCSLETFAELADMKTTIEAVDALDRAITDAEILSLDDAQAIAEEAMGLEAG